MLTEWRDIPGFPNYQISNDGQVLSFARQPQGAQLGRFIDESGYYRLGLYQDGPTGRKRINKRIHQLVAEAFIGPRPPGAVIRHIDGNPLNNSIDNLTWGSQSENVRDCVAHGTQRNIRKTCCPRGHEYSPDNTLVESRGNRKCRTCRRDAERARRARSKVSS